MPESLYAVLGVPRDASDKDIKKAYRRLARELHPDVNPSDERAEERFKEVSAAHETLGDPARRKLYDEFGDASTRLGFDAEQARARQRWQQQARWQGPGGMGGDPAMFEQLFGRRRGPRRGTDMQATLSLDFRCAALGGQRRLSFVDGRDLEVRIPPGVADGGHIRLRGKGHPGMGGGPPGDLIIGIRVEPDPVFSRDGLDLHLELPITVVEAVKGARVEVPLLDGSVKLRVPPSSQSGQRLRLKKKGVARKGKPTGDLFVHLVVHAPPELDDDTCATLEAAYTGGVREHLSPRGG